MDKSMKILVVDDFLMMCWIVCNLFKELGYLNVDEVEDGLVGFVWLCGGGYDFVIFDWNMLNFDGFVMLKEICVDVMFMYLLVLMVMVELKKENIIVVV